MKKKSKVKKVDKKEVEDLSDVVLDKIDEFGGFPKNIDFRKNMGCGG